MLDDIPRKLCRINPTSTTKFFYLLDIEYNVETWEDFKKWIMENKVEFRKIDIKDESYREFFEALKRNKEKYKREGIYKEDPDYPYIFTLEWFINNDKFIRFKE